MGQDKDKEKTAQQNTWHWYSSFISLTTLDESLPMDRTRLVFFDEKSNRMVDVLTLNPNEEKRYAQIEEMLQRLSKERRLFYYEPGERLPRRLLTGEDGLVTKTELVDREPQVKPQPKKMKLWKRALNTMTFGRLFKQEKKDYEDAVEAYQASVKEHALWEQEVQKGIPACFDRGEEAVRDESLRRERELDKEKRRKI
ncbi:MAG: hypothetical protein ACI4FX_12660 [Agathobacter sp.]